VENNVYHIALADDWQEGIESGFYTPKAFVHEGFIHASYPHQLQGVLKRFFKPTDRLVLLKLRTDVLGKHLVPEWVASQEQYYPHIFCPIQSKMVEHIWPLEEGFVLPPEVQEKSPE
jgi:uncharacterized protein (DUF952 family)